MKNCSRFTPYPDMMSAISHPFCSRLIWQIASFMLVGNITCTAWMTEAAERKLYWHGFLAQGLIQAEDSSFINDDGDISTDLTDIGFNASYTINDRLRAAGQLIYLNGDNRYPEGVRIDYLLLDWSIMETVDWSSNLFLGRFKNNHWLYSSTRDVPHARPSIVLPQSVYFDAMRDAGLIIQGVGLDIQHMLSDGSVKFELSVGKESLDDDAAKQALSLRADGELRIAHSATASVKYSPQSERWQTYISYTDVGFDYDASQQEELADAEASLSRIMLGSIYSGEYWELSGEIFQEKLGVEGLYFQDFNSSTTSQGGYLQVRYFYGDDLTLLGRVDSYDRDKDDRNGSHLAASSGGLIPAYFAYMDTLTMGLSWDLQPNLRLQMEHHWVRGTGRLGPIVEPNLARNQDKYWNMWAAQIMYWF